jgi:hypothetical protein
MRAVIHLPRKAFEKSRVTTHFNDFFFELSENKMNKMYVIHWKSKVNGRAGTGTKLFERDEAESLVDELNREYPQIEHEIWEASRRSEMPVTGSSSASADAGMEPMEMMAAR